MNPSHTTEVQVVSETARRDMAAAEAAEPKERTIRLPRPRGMRKQTKADQQAPADLTTPPEKEAA